MKVGVLSTINSVCTGKYGWILGYCETSQGGRGRHSRARRGVCIHLLTVVEPLFFVNEGKEQCGLQV